MTTDIKVGLTSLADRPGGTILSHGRSERHPWEFPTVEAWERANKVPMWTAEDEEKLRERIFRVTK